MLARVSSGLSRRGGFQLLERLPRGASGARAVPVARRLTVAAGGKAPNGDESSTRRGLLGGAAANWLLPAAAAAAFGGWMLTGQRERISEVMMAGTTLFMPVIRLVR